MLFDRTKTHKPKNFTLKFFYNLLTLQKQSQIGNTLGVGMAIGLVALGGTTVALMNASKDQTNVVSDEQTKQAIAAAEGGATRIQDILAKNPRLAMVDWFDNKGNPKSVENLITAVNNGAVAVPNGGSCINFEDASSGSIALTETEEEEIEDQLTNPTNNTTIASAFQPLGADTEFRLVALEPAENLDPGASVTITVQGRKTTGDAIAQFELEIPVTPKSGSGTESFPGTSFGPPGLWAQNFGKNPNSQGVRINANVVDSSQCNPSATKTWNEYLAGFNTAPQNAFKADFESVQSNLKFPSLPNGGNYSAPSTRSVLQIAQGVPRVRSDELLPISSCPAKNTVLPRVGDVPVSGNTTSGKYVYNFNLNNCTVTLGKSGQETIEIYSSGAISTKNASVASGSTVIVHGNNGLTMNGNASLDENNPQNFQLYIYNGDVNVGGTTETVGFIFAPNSTASYGGNSSHFGAIWAKTVQGNGGGGDGGITATLTNDHLDDLLIDVTTETTPLPKTNPAIRATRTPVN